jgi:hypothetical protein
VNQVILSGNTVRALLEAHASMAAWYYQMSAALHHAGASVAPPSDAQRQAHLAAVAQEFPALAAAAQSIHMPRAYVPRPATPAPATVTENEGVHLPEPPKDYVATPAVLTQEQGPEKSTKGQASLIEPPAKVNPLAVKYEEN